MLPCRLFPAVSRANRRQSGYNTQLDRTGSQGNHHLHSPGGRAVRLRSDTASVADHHYVGRQSGLPLASGKVSLARAFASHFKTDVWGFESHVDPGPEPYGFYTKPSVFHNFLGTVYFHCDLSSVLPVLVPALPVLLPRR